MTGTITKHKKQSGRQSWGYWFRAGKDESGKWIQKTRSGFETKDEARKALDAAIKEFDSQAEKGSPAIGRTTKTVSEYVTYWLDEHAAARCEPKTMERYRDFGVYLRKQIGEVRMVTLDVPQIQACVNRLKAHGGKVTQAYPEGKPLASRTVRHIATMLTGMLSDAARLGHIETNPMLGRKVKLPKRIKTRPSVIEAAKLIELYRAAENTRIYPFLVFGGATGCRRGEMCALTWKHVNFATGSVLICASLEQTKKGGLRVKQTKSDEGRDIEVDEFTLDVLKAHHEDQKKDRELFGSEYGSRNLVFCRPDGYFYSPDRIGARVKEYMAKVGLEGVSLHSLRHTHASIMLSKGVPLPVVSERLGHKDQNVTLAVYSHALPTDRKAATRTWRNALAEVIAEDRAQESVEERKTEEKRRDRKPKRARAKENVA